MTELPDVFRHEGEAVPLLARAKKKAAAKFSLAKQGSLRSASDLAYWLAVFRRDGESIAVCRVVGQLEFDGDFNLWS